LHHLRTHSSIRRFRVAALLLFGNYLFAPFAAGLLAYSLLLSRREGVMLGAALMSISVTGVLVQWVVASRVNCPLCMTAVLAPRACMKNRRARSFLGSHRLRVALAILFKNRFRCQYCNEPTAMRIRERLRGNDTKRHLQQSRRCR
jgi:hypothetical protein